MRGAAAAPSGRCAKPRRTEDGVRVAALAGGTGAAKLLRGLAASLDSSALSVVVNTGDDAEVWGLHVSPDLDSVMYALAGVLDPGRGWGRADEAFRCLSAMAVYGAPTWFGLGDREAIRDADLIVVCPSTPVTSAGPIRAVPGVAEALGATRASVVGVSPIVGGAAVSGPAGALLRARGLPVSPLGIARAYVPWLRALLIAPEDAACAPELAALGVRAVVTDVMMPEREREATLARAVLAAR